MGYLAAPSMNKWCQVLLLACWMAGSSSVWAIQRNGNSYELNIAISDRVAAFNDAQSKAALLQSIEKTMTEVSRLLFQATDYYFYFGTINILLPRSWTGIPNVTPANTATVTYTNADMRLEETQNDLEQLVEAARTKHSKLCGQPGEYIILPPQFFTDINGSTTLKYGDKAKVILHEFAHYRYGVFEEYGYPDEDYKDPTSKYPYYFVNKRGNPQLTGCYDQPIEGTFSNANGVRNCSTLNDQTCRFKPNMNAASGPASSLMFWQFLPTVNKFCDSSNHDPTAPNKHNYWCRNRSIKSVMTRTADYITAPRPQPLSPTQNTVPTFRYLLPVPQTVYVVLDRSSHTAETADAFSYIKNELATKFMNTMESSYSRSYVGVAGMGGSTMNYANNRLGGYLAEVQPTIQVLGNRPTIVSKINGLTRSESGLLLEPAVLDMGDNLSPFAQQSGSIVLLIKLGTITGKDQMNVETEAVHLLNSRSIRLVTLEIGTENVLQRVTELTNGAYFTGTPSNYQTQLTDAFNAVFGYLNASPNYVNRRVQLVKSPFTTQIVSNVNRYDGFTYIDWTNSGLELNFFIPITVTDNVTILVQDNRNVRYPPVQTYLSWNGQYRVYTVATTFKPTGYWKYSIRSSGTNPLSGFVDVVEILPDSAPVHIGGGGLPSVKPVEFEVYTSGNNGVLTMSSVSEDQSMIIYVAGKKGYSNPIGLQKAVATIRRSSTGTLDRIDLKDDGIYPDMVDSDGIYTGYYRPPADGIYNISVNLERTTTQTPISTKSLISGSDSPMSYSMSIDQTEFCCGAYANVPSVAASFQRHLTFAASVRVSGVQFFTDRPTRIMDLRIVPDVGNSTKVTLTWTAPASRYGSTDPVDRYQLVYGTMPSSIIDESGLIPAGAVEVSPSDVLEGSLTPLAPGGLQTVTIRVQRVPAEMPPPLYFTIGSISNATQRMTASFPSPMQFLIGNGTENPSTTSTPSTTTTPPLTSTSTTPTSTVTTPTSTVTTPTSTTTITTTTSASTTRTSTSSFVSTAPPSEFVCPAPYGYYAIPGAVCSTKYIQCSASVAYYHDCAPRTVWNNRLQTCDWPANVPGC